MPFFLYCIVYFFCALYVCSSHHNRHENKKASVHLPLNTNLQSQSDESVVVNNTGSDDLMSPFQAKASDADPIENLPTMADDVTSSTEEKITFVSTFCDYRVVFI